LSQLSFYFHFAPPPNIPNKIVFSFISNKAKKISQTPICFLFFFLVLYFFFFVRRISKHLFSFSFGLSVPPKIVPFSKNPAFVESKNTHRNKKKNKTEILTFFFEIRTKKRFPPAKKNLFFFPSIIERKKKNLFDPILWRKKSIYSKTEKNSKKRNMHKRSIEGSCTVRIQKRMRIHEDKPLSIISPTHTISRTKNSDDARPYAFMPVKRIISDIERSSSFRKNLESSCTCEWPPERGVAVSGETGERTCAFLGEGTYAKVWRIHDSSGSPKAKKIFKDRDEPVSAIREICSLSTLSRHPNILQILGMRIDYVDFFFRSVDCLF
jgi:hypothetical protein